LNIFIKQCDKYIYMKYISVKGLQKTLEIEYPVKLNLSEENNSIILDLIMVKEDKRCKGFGTKVMEKIINYADTHHLNIQLTPSKDYGSNVRRLRKFYKRFDFQKNNNRYYALIRHCN
jgi:GNAT superfamily N-acetyltransferase